MDHRWISHRFDRCHQFATSALASCKYALIVVVHDAACLTYLHQHACSHFSIARTAVFLADFNLLFSGKSGGRSSMRQLELTTHFHVFRSLAVAARGHTVLDDDKLSPTDPPGATLPQRDQEPVQLVDPTTMTLSLERRDEDIQSQSVVNIVVHALDATLSYDDLKLFLLTTMMYEVLRNWVPIQLYCIWPRGVPDLIRRGKFCQIYFSSGLTLVHNMLEKSCSKLGQTCSYRNCRGIILNRFVFFSF